MAQARRAVADIVHRGTNISRFSKDFSFTDNYDQTDQCPQFKQNQTERSQGIKVEDHKNGKSF